MSKEPKCIACGVSSRLGLANLVPCGENTYICPDCAGAAARCFEARGSPAPAQQAHAKSAIPTPNQLVAALDRTVIGQAEAKKSLAVAGWKHLQRCKGNTNLPPAHVLLYGPTGCGKTHLAKSLAQLLDVPFVSVDATSITETGYKGRNVSDIISDVLEAALDNAEKAKNAVVFVDEFDKLAASGGDTRTAYQYGTQHGFLTLLEGAPIATDRKGTLVTVDTSGLLFIFAGAFGGLEDILSARLHPNAKRPIGFVGKHTTTTIPPTTLLQSAIPADFVHYGITAELMGRIPILAPILPLTEDELAQVLTDPDGSLLARYKAFFTKLNINFSVAPSVVTALAQEAHNSGSGARGLKGQLEHLITNALFDTPEGGEIHITADLAGKGSGGNECPARVAVATH